MATTMQPVFRQANFLCATNSSPMNRCRQEEPCVSSSEMSISPVRNFGIAKSAVYRMRTNSSLSETDVLQPQAVVVMKSEVDAAVDFLTYLLVKARFGKELADSFRTSLTWLLLQHYDGHWYPSEPLKGSGYRCLRVNGVMHPILAIAAELCSIPSVTFRKAFPAELTIWIDPGDVNVRIGEEGSIGVYFAKSSADGTPRGNASGSASPTPNGSATATTPLSSKTSTTRRIQRAVGGVRSANVSPTRLFDARCSPTSAIAAGNSPLPSTTVATNGNGSYQLCANVHLGARETKWWRQNERGENVTTSTTTLVPVADS